MEGGRIWDNNNQKLESHAKIPAKGLVFVFVWQFFEWKKTFLGLSMRQLGDVFLTFLSQIFHYNALFQFDLNISHQKIMKAKATIPNSFFISRVASKWLNSQEMVINETV